MMWKKLKMSLKRKEERNERHPVPACYSFPDEDYGDVGKLILPRPATLKRYGLTLEDWQEIFLLQNGLCPICERPLEKPVVDHLHIRNWRKMKPEKRKRYVRGIPCSYCNRRRLARGMSLKIARNIVAYLEKFEDKLNEI